MVPTSQPGKFDTGNSLQQLFSREVGACKHGMIPVLTNDVELPYNKYTKSRGLQTATETHEHGATRMVGSFRGLSSDINIWNPNVEKNSEFSLSQVWLIIRDADGSARSTLEAGWHVYPSFGSPSPRLFVFWTRDGYDKTGCYNLKCRGFVQVSNKVVLGGEISTKYSEIGSTQYDVRFVIHQDTGRTHNWWLNIGGEDVGYWLVSEVPDFVNAAQDVELGGEVYCDKIPGVAHTGTDMGSGNFPHAGFQHAAYHKNIKVLDDNLEWQHALNLAIIPPEAPTCYSVGNPQFDSSSGVYFFYGGPGFNSDCQ